MNEKRFHFMTDEELNALDAGEAGGEGSGVPLPKARCNKLCVAKGKYCRAISTQGRRVGIIHSCYSIVFWQEGGDSRPVPYEEL